MIVDEGVIVEIVRPGTGDSVAVEEVGEVVVTTFNRDYPMIRFATGDLSAILPGRSPAGAPTCASRAGSAAPIRTTKVKGMFVHPEQIAEVARRHAGLGRLRLVVGRTGEQDTMTLRAESSAIDSGLKGKLVESLQAITKLKGEVELVPLNSLPNDGKVIADERTYNQLSLTALPPKVCPHPRQMRRARASASDSSGLLDGLHRHRLVSVTISKGCGLDLFELDLASHHLALSRPSAGRDGLGTRASPLWRTAPAEPAMSSCTFLPAWLSRIT